LVCDGERHAGHDPARQLPLSGVEVPAGDSIVEFRYRPASVRIGAMITAATLLALVTVVVLRRRRRGRCGEPR
jgi:hypothetical protein